MPPARVTVARIVRAKGVRGEVRAEPMTHTLGRFAALASVWLEHPQRGELALEVERWRPDGDHVLLKFRGIDTPEAARERLVGGYVTIPVDQVAALPPDTYYVFQLTGCKVVAEGGAEIGVIRAVLSMPSTDVYQVDTGSGEVLIPAVRDFVVEVRPEEKRVVVRGVDELLGPA